MSKYVKDLISQDIARRLEGVEDALLVNVIGLDAIKTQQLRKKLRDKGIKLMVIKNSLARRATTGSRLEGAFAKGASGTLALIWGGGDIISLAKEVVALDKAAEFEQFQARGGVMDGGPLTAEGIKEISKWPNRAEQLSILVGQILSPGANLSSQLLGPGGKLASQIKKKSEGAEEPAAEAA